MFLKQLFFLLVLFKFSSARKYDNYVLYRGVPVADEHLKFFNEMPSRFEVNFWREPEVLWKPVEFAISPKDKEQFENLADRNGIYLTTLAENLQSLLDKSTPPEEKFKARTFNWKSYQKLDAIYNWMTTISAINPRSVKVFSIGETAEKRKIMVLHIAFPSGFKEPRPKVIIEGGIHAREWIGVSFVTYMIDQLLKGTNEEAKGIRSAYEFFFIPVLNPDGYAYSHEQDRLWRKNRNYGGYGVDLNRNFDALFGAVGSSSNRSSEKYCGPKVFSERESQALKSFLEKNSKDLGYYISFHSYGQHFVIPYLYSEAHLGNYDQMKQLGTEAGNHLYKRYNTSYTVGTAMETVGYSASGASVCWAKKTFNIPVVFLLELRDTGKYGFALPPDLITPICEETLDAVLAILRSKMNLRSTDTDVPVETKAVNETKVVNPLATKGPSIAPQKKAVNVRVESKGDARNNATKNTKKVLGRKKRKHGKTVGRNGQTVFGVNIYLLSLLTFVFLL